MAFLQLFLVWCTLCHSTRRAANMQGTSRCRTPIGCCFPCHKPDPAPLPTKHQSPPGWRLSPWSGVAEAWSVGREGGTSASAHSRCQPEQTSSVSDAYSYVYVCPSVSAGTTSRRTSKQPPPPPIGAPSPCLPVPVPGWRALSPRPCPRCTRCTTRPRIATTPCGTPPPTTGSTTPCSATPRGAASVGLAGPPCRAFGGWGERRPPARSLWELQWLDCARGVPAAAEGSH